MRGQRQRKTKSDNNDQVDILNIILRINILTFVLCLTIKYI